MNANVIELDRLQKIYRTGDVEVRAVDGVSLQVQRGEFVAIMGTSGSGKSTLMNIVGCLDQPTDGTCFIDGADVAHLSRKEVSRLRNQKIGFVFQSFNLLTRTSAANNVELPLYYTRPRLSSHERRQRAVESLRNVGLGDRLHNHPNQLSGGQQQRVAIARALVNRPELVLADEPTGNLDSRTSIEVMGIFQSLNDAGITVVMVTHELEIATYCKRIIVMRDGKIIRDEVNPTRTLAADQLNALTTTEQLASLL